MVQPDLRRVGFAAALALAAFAYRPLVASALMLPNAHQLESWLFRPGQLPAPFVFALCAWLLWRRRAGLRALPARASVATAVPLALLAALSFTWARLTSSAHLLLPALAATGLACAASVRGRAGARAALWPALVLLLGLPIPAPLRQEIVWGLQLATASGAGKLLAWSGRDFVREGVILHDAVHSFHVIDGCSGLQGIATLIAIAVVVRELFALAGLRALALFALAPALGYALNVVRIAFIAGSPNPEAYAGLQGDHTPQGVALLAGGTLLLYGIGHLLARRSSPVLDAGPPQRAARAGGAAALAGLAALALMSLVLSPFPEARAPAWPNPTFPETAEGWVSERLYADPFYLPPAAATRALYRRYPLDTQQHPRVVDLLIGAEANDGSDTTDLFASKLVWPGPEWNLVHRERMRISDLGLDANLALAARGTGPERAVIYHWLVRDEGLLRESLRALLALDASPFRRATPRTAVRLVAFAPTAEPLPIERAKQRIDLFIATFRGPLSAL